MNIGFVTLITKVFFQTEGSIFLAMILHTSFNVTATPLPVTQAATGNSLPFAMIAVIMCAVAAIIVIIRKQEFLSVQKCRFV
jgi:hypothetical protein